MTTPKLSQAVADVMAFDWSIHAVNAEELRWKDCCIDAVVTGADWENTRIRAIVEKLCACVDALEHISAMKINCIASHSEEFRDGSHTAFCQAAEPADEALAELRKELKGE